MSAEDYYQQVMRNPNFKITGRVTGEDFCWHAAYAADDFVRAYLAWGDPAWLDQGQRYFDWLVSLMEKAPDGYRGWIGPYIYGPQVWCDVHVGDAILVSPMLHFAEVVLGDSALEKHYGDRARAYVELARKDLMEKWDARGTWRVDGEGGAYVSWDHYLEPGKLDAWRKLDADKSTLSLPYNKQMDMAVVALRLYRLTGEEGFRERAWRIFWQFKSRLQYFDDHYVWNYWEARVPGGLEIRLYSAKGELKKVLFRGRVEGGLDGLEGFSLVRWDGTDPEDGERYAGKYRVRWTLGGEYREVEVVIE